MITVADLTCFETLTAIRNDRNFDPTRLRWTPKEEWPSKMQAWVVTAAITPNVHTAGRWFKLASEMHRNIGFSPIETCHSTSQKEKRKKRSRTISSGPAICAWRRGRRLKCPHSTNSRNTISISVGQLSTEANKFRQTRASPLPRYLIPIAGAKWQTRRVGRGKNERMLRDEAAKINRV